MQRLRMDKDKVFCRLCANKTEVLVNVFENGENLAEKISKHLSIQINKTDSLPVSCCVQCVRTISEWHKFTQSIADAQLNLQQMLQKTYEDAIK